MNGQNNEQSTHETCRKHCVRSERELYRVCPSKLSKRELEDLYFSIIEENQELKKTINCQQDKLKVLSTKVQRMTASHKTFGKGPKDCCAYAKALILEQKESISDLKKTNANLTERIRVLNMRLCSAKQFLRRCPGSAKCPNCNCITTMSGKNSTMSVIHPKRSEMQIRSTTVSNQNLENDAQSSRTVETETEERKIEIPEKLCDENKCRTQMEELKQKIVDLQEELCKTHTDYSNRIARLEQEVSDLWRENQQVRSERVAGQHALQLRERRVEELGARLRSAEANYNDLAIELSIEKKKVTELETRVKAIDMSNMVAKAIEERLTKTIEERLSVTKETIEVPVKEPAVPIIIEPPLASPPPRFEKSSQVETPPPLERHRLSISPEKPDEKRYSKHSDDSGYTDNYRSPDTPKISEDKNKELLEKISALHNELKMLKEKAVMSAHQVEATPGPSNQFKMKEEIPSQDERTADVICHPSCTPKRNSKTVKNIDTDQKTSSSDEMNNSELEDRVRQKQDEIAKAAKRESIVEAQRYKLLSEVVEDNKKMAGDVSDDDREPEKKPEEQKYTSVQQLEKDFESEVKRSKRDAHNRYQIPGPIPNGKTGLDVTSRPRKVSKIKQFLESKHKNKESRKKNAAAGSSQAQETKIYRAPEHSQHNLENALGEHMYDDLHAYASNLNQVDRKKPLFENYISDDIDQNSDNEGKLKNVQRYQEPHSSTNRIYEQIQTDEPGAMAEVSESVNDAPRLELCEHYVRVCSCRAATRRDVAIFRTCSGTLRFKTTSTNLPDLRQCPCAVNNDKEPAETAMPSCAGIQTGEAPTSGGSKAGEDKCRRHSLTYTKSIMYSRATSPENTDHEISTLTDLPSEGDDKIRSLGEDKATTTFNDTGTILNSIELEHLSEGELPQPKHEETLSTGETKSTFTNKNLAEKETSYRMQEALQAISEELALCRELLQCQRPSEPKSAMKDACQSAERDEHGAELRPAVASPHIGDAFTPKCLFTLHVGTVVLSDEAVINSRELPLMLTWKFFDQNSAMTRMPPGRVVLFDFSTEYDVKITDRFLEYMKYEEMQLIISEFDKQTDCFASCALPLRDALLHTNRRADMSLALVAGPQLRRARETRDTLVSGDEVGVLDLWCMLRVDPIFLPTINRALAKVNSPKSSKDSAKCVDSNNSQVMEQVSNDDISTEPDPKPHNLRHRKMRISEIDTMHMYSKENGINMKERDTLRDYDLKKLREKKRCVTDETDDYDLDKLREKKSTVRDEESQASTIIVNEVPTKIATAQDMKLALDRNAAQNALEPITKLGKIDDDVSETRSKIGSWRGLKREIYKQSSNRKTSTEKRKAQHKVPSYLKNSWERNSDPKDMYMPSPRPSLEDEGLSRKNLNTYSSSKTSVLSKKIVTIKQQSGNRRNSSNDRLPQSIEIKILWLALNEECDAMTNPRIQRLYVAYNFLGRSGAELETPLSLPKPRSYVDKCYFNFSKAFYLSDCDLPLLGHMAQCRSPTKGFKNLKDCITFTVISEPPEDPLGLDTCEDIGHAFLYLGDLLAYSAGNNSYTEVIPVESAQEGEPACGVLAVNVDGLDVLRHCLALVMSRHDNMHRLWSMWTKSLSSC